MMDNRYNRWQGLSITQFSVAIALISGLSIAGIGAGLTLLQDKGFVLVEPFKYIFFVSLILLVLALLLNSGAVITRLLDFRLTARKVRKDTKTDYNKPLTIFYLGPDTYGRITWTLFWISCLLFITGVILLVISVAVAYKNSLF